MKYDFMNPKNLKYKQFIEATIEELLIDEYQDKSKEIEMSQELLNAL